MRESLLYELEDYSLALTYFNHSLEIYGEHSGTLCNMALCHRLLGQDEPAETLLHQVLQFDPNNPFAQSLLAGKIEATESSDTPSHSRNNRKNIDPNTLYHLALHHYQQQQLDTALEYLNHTLELDPDFDSARAMRIKIRAEINWRRELGTRMGRF